MRKLAICLLFLPASSLSIQAQECCPKYEISIGYSYFNAGPEGVQIISDQFSSRYRKNGLGGGFALNRSSKLGIIGDFSYQSKELTISELTIGSMPLETPLTQLKTFAFHFGPRVSARSAGSTFFVHALAGGIRRKVKSTGTFRDGGSQVSKTFSTTAIDLALSFGGGIDLEASRHLGIRLFQFDYIPIRTETDLSSREKIWNQSYRIQVGFVVRFGDVK